MQLKGRSALISGANRGFGRAIAETFVAEGADVLLVARDGVLMEQVATELQSRKVNSEQKIHWLAADIASPEDVERINEAATTHLAPLTILVNNAGVYGPIGSLDEVDWNEWLEALRINLVGTLMITRACLPGFKSKSYGKIINLSGGGATAPLPRFSAYAASKAAIVRLTETLAQELTTYHVDVNAVAPGALNTRLLDQVLAAGPERAGEDFYRRSLKQQEEGGASLKKAVQLMVWLASAQSDGLSGRLISAVWDNWQDFAQLREKIMAGDVYTLRRIVPADRGWE